MVVDKEYYEILEVSPDADEKQIKKAYRKMALKWHPDRHLENKSAAEEKFKKISEAYQVLSDPEKKKIYDQFGKQGLQGGAGMGSTSGFTNMGGGQQFHFQSASDLFEQMFGGRDPFNIFQGGGFGGMGGRSGRPGMGGFGGFGGMNGFGDEFEDDFSGFRGGRRAQPNEVRHTVKVTLEDLFKQKKKKIKMTIQNQEKVFEFDLHGKVKTGTKVRYTNALENGQDLVFEIQVLPHNTFEKDGIDLSLRKNISIGDALAGCRFTVKRLDGTDLVIDTKDKIIKTGTTYRLQNEGLPYPGGRGDLHINFNVVFPDSLTNQQRQKIREAFPR